jgi:hypothetical protein
MTPAQRIADIAAALVSARTASADGARIDLAGLSAAVEEAMRDAQAAPLAERAALTAALLGLLQELDALVATLARQHHAEAQQRAAVAYSAHGRGDRTE